MLFTWLCRAYCVPATGIFMGKCGKHGPEMIRELINEPDDSWVFILPLAIPTMFVGLVAYSLMWPITLPRTIKHGL